MRPLRPGGRPALALALVLLLAGVLAGPAAAAGTRSARTLVSGGETRSYVTYRPASAPASGAPLVIVLHGANSSGAGMEHYTGFDAVADQGGFVVAYPDAVTDPSTGTNLWRIGCCDAWRDAPTDVQFTSDLIDALVASDGVDPSRVSVVGFSVGAAMAYRLGCELSSRIAAIGSVGGYEYLSKPCAPDRPVSVYEMHGTLDYFGGSCGGTTQSDAGCSFGQPGYIPSVAETNQQWRALDGCGGQTSGQAAGAITQQVWDGCRAGAGVRLDIIQDGRHCYPTLLSTSCAQYDASGQFWSFFAGRRLAPAPPAAPLAPAPARAGVSAHRCVVPDVRRLSLSRARRRLAAGGCALGAVRRPARRRSGAPLVVAAQAVRPGARRPWHARVALRLRAAR